MSEKQQRLVLSIIDFLNQSINDGTVKADDTESLEVAGELSHAISEEEMMIYVEQYNASVRLSASIHRTGPK